MIKNKNKTSLGPTTQNKVYCFKCYDFVTLFVELQPSIQKYMLYIYHRNSKQKYNIIIEDNTSYYTFSPDVKNSEYYALYETDKVKNITLAKKNNKS